MSSQSFSFAGGDYENLMKNLCVNFLGQKILAKSKVKEFWPHSFTACRTPLYYTHSSAKLSSCRSCLSLFLNQSWSSIKKVAAINVTSLNQANVYIVYHKNTCLLTGYLEF